jgi:hypothetical protein
MRANNMRFSISQGALFIPDLTPPPPKRSGRRSSLAAMLPNMQQRRSSIASALFPKRQAKLMIQGASGAFNSGTMAAADRAARRMIHRVASRAFNSWVAMSDARRTTLLRLREVANLLLSPELAGAFYHWVGAAAREQRSLEDLKSKATTSALAVLFLDASTASLGMSIYAYYVKELGGSARHVGTLLATYAGCNILASMWIGAASDKIGRRPVMVISIVGVAIGFLGQALAQSLGWLIVARGWVGFWSGVGSCCRAYIADVTSEDERTTFMGKAAGVGLLGFSVGAPLGSILALLPGGYPVPFFFGAIGAALLAPAIAMRLPPTELIRAELDRLESSGVASPKACAPKGQESPKRDFVRDASPIPVRPATEARAARVRRLSSETLSTPALIAAAAAAEDDSPIAVRAEESPDTGTSFSIARRARVRRQSQNFDSPELMAAAVLEESPSPGSSSPAFVRSGTPSPGTTSPSFIRAPLSSNPSPKNVRFGASTVVATIDNEPGLERTFMPPVGLKPGAVPRLILLSVASLMIVPPQAFVMAVWPLYIGAVFGWGAQVFALFIVAYTVIAALTQFLVLGKAAQQFGLIPLGVAAMFTTSLGHVLITASAASIDFQSTAFLNATRDSTAMPRTASTGELILVFLGYSLIVASAGFAGGVVAPTLSKLGDSSVQGRLMGLNSGLEVGGRMGTQIIVTLLYDISPFYSCLMPAITSCLAATLLATVLYLERQADAAALTALG